MLIFLWILIVQSTNTTECVCQNYGNSTCLINQSCSINISSINGIYQNVQIQDCTIQICFQRIPEKPLFNYSDLTIINASIKHDEKCITTHPPKLYVLTQNLSLYNSNITFSTYQFLMINTTLMNLINSSINVNILYIIADTLYLNNSLLKANKQNKSTCSCLVNEVCLGNDENTFLLYSYVENITNSYQNLTIENVSNKWHQYFNNETFDLALMTYYSVVIGVNNTLNLTQNSKIRGYYMGIYSYTLQLDSNSSIDADGMGELTNEGYGCGYTDKIIGLRQQCGGTGGSHGGVGGISTSPKTNYNQLCLQLQSKQIYDYSFYPVLPGSGGGGVTYGQWPEALEISGQGGGVIYLEAITLINDGIISANGSSKFSQPFVGSGSGGSIQVRIWFISGSGFITAAGGGIGQQIDGDSYQFAKQKFYQTYEVYGGFGGGGRIRLLFFNISEMLNNTNVSSINNTIQANAGQMSQYQSLALNISGQNSIKFQGSIIPTGCPQGKTGNFCNNCTNGTFKFLFGQAQCQPCLNQINNLTYYNQSGETSPFCNVSCVQNSKQPHEYLCQAGLWEFSDKLGGQNSIFALFVIIILLIINIGIVWMSKENKQKKSRQYYGSYDETTMQQMTTTLPEYNNKTHLISHDLLYHMKRVYLAGNNMYNDPWHIYEETAKDLDNEGNLELLNFFEKFNQQAEYAKWEKILLIIFKFYYYPLYLWILKLRQNSKFKELSKLFIHQENLFISEGDYEFHPRIKLKFSCSKDKTLAFLDKLNLSQKIIEQSDEIELPLTLILSGLGTFPYPFQINIHDALIKRLWSQFRNALHEDQINLFEKFVTEFNYYAVKIDFRQSQASFIKRFSDLLSFANQYNAEIFKSNHQIQVDICIHLIAQGHGQNSFLYLLGNPSQRELEYLLSQIHTVQNFSYDFVIKVSIIFNHYNPENNRALESYTNNVSKNINQQILMITGQEEDNVRNQLFQQKRQMQSKMNRDKFDGIKKYKKQGILVFKRGFTWLFSQITRYRDSRINQQLLIAGICVMLALQWCFVIAYPVILFIVYDNEKQMNLPEDSIFLAEFVTQLVVFPLAQIISLAILSAWLLKQRRNYGKMYLIFNLCGLASSLIEFIFGCYDLFKMNSSAEYNLFKLFPFFFILLSSHLVCLQMNLNELNKTKYFEI